MTTRNVLSILIITGFVLVILAIIEGLIATQLNADPGMVLLIAGIALLFVSACISVPLILFYSGW